LAVIFPFLFCNFLLLSVFQIIALGLMVRPAAAAAAAAPPPPPAILIT
jgi:hypothetical protein